MFADTFIQFLRIRNVLNDKQAKEVLAKKIPKVRPEVIAVYDGLITGEQAYRLSERQHTCDMPFGFLAVREGLITNEQLAALMERATRDDLRIMQALADKELMTMSGVLDAFKEFKEYYSLDDGSYNALVENKAEYFVKHIGGINRANDIFALYAAVFIETFTKCIDSRMRIEKACLENEISGKYLVKATCCGERVIYLGLILDDDESALNLVGRFIKQRLREYGEDAEDSIKEFMNIVAGLFVTRLEKDLGLDVELSVPEMSLGGAYTNERINVIDVYSSDCRLKMFLTE